MRCVARAITFDVGGTLLEPWPSVGEVYLAVAREWGAVAADPAEVNRRFAAVWRARRSGFDYSRAAWAGVVAETLRGLTPWAAEPAFFERLYAHFAGPKPWRVFPEVKPVLAALRQRGFRLAVLSNWDERLPGLLEALNLAGWFERVLVSGLVGWHKPDRRLFAHAAAQLGVAPAHLLHIGDDWVEDVEGARAAGWQAAWLCRQGDPPPAGEVLRLAALAELPARVAWP